VKAYYDARAPEYDDWFHGIGRYADRDRPEWDEDLAAVVATIAGLPPARTLDVACGTAFLSRHLRGELTFLDQSARMLAIAGERVPRAELVQSDAIPLPFADRAFDYVVASMLLHYFGFDEAERLLHTWRRLATGAVIAADVERHWLPYLAIRVLAQVSSSPLFDEGHRRTIRRGFTTVELARLGSRAGFAQVRVSRQFPYRLCFVGPV